MTTRRLIASLTASGAALALAATVAVRSFPLEAQGQRAAAAAAHQARSGDPIQIVKGAEHLLHAALPEDPHRAIEQRVEGEVLLDLAIDDRGEVSDARVLSGPDELRKAALESVLQWHYSPDAIRSLSTQAALRFHLPAGESRTEPGKRVITDAVTSGEEMKMELISSDAQEVEHRMMEIEQALNSSRTTDAEKQELELKYADAKKMIAKIHADREAHEVKSLTFKLERGADARTFDGTARLARVKTERVSEAMANEVLTRAGVKVGDPITEDTARRIREVASRVDEHVQVSFGSDGAGRIVLVLVSR